MGIYEIDIKKYIFSKANKLEFFFKHKYKKYFIEVTCFQLFRIGEMKTRNCIALTNGKAITPFCEIDKSCILIKSKCIKEVGKVNEFKIPNDAQLIR